MSLLLLGACAKEPPARSVQEFLDNEILREAAMVRCARDRLESRYDEECVNVRQAVKIVAAREERQLEAEREAMSEQKRQALRQTLDAAEAARNRAEALRREREEAAYLAQFETVPDAASTAGEAADNTPSSGSNPPPASQTEAAATSEAGTADEPAAEPAPDGSDLNAIREALKDRQGSEPD